MSKDIYSETHKRIVDSWKENPELAFQASVRARVHNLDGTLTEYYSSKPGEEHVNRFWAGSSEEARKLFPDLFEPNDNEFYGVIIDTKESKLLHADQDDPAINNIWDLWSWVTPLLNKLTRG